MAPIILPLLNAEEISQPLPNIDKLPTLER